MTCRLKRKYLTQNEIQKLMLALKIGRYSERNECIFCLCFTHGLRVSEVCDLKISDINLVDKVIHIKRLKNGLSTTQPLLKIEIKLLKSWFEIRNNKNYNPSDYLFISQKGGRISRQQIYNILRKHGLLANISTPLHPHMLRHSCGFALANIGADTRLIQDYLGHRNIHHTVLYTVSNSTRFIGIWKEHPIY